MGSITRGQPRELGFSFIYESTTSPKGQFEFEKWVTWKNGNESGNKVEFRHEIEYGVTDRLQAAGRQTIQKLEATRGLMWRSRIQPWS